MFKVKLEKQVGVVVTTCLLVAAMVGICSTRLNAATTDVDQLFQQARTQAAQLARDAGVMGGFAYSSDSWQSQGREINLIKGHINKLGEIVSQIQARRGDVGKEHQVTIDRILPPLRELAANTTAMIDYLNKYQGRLRLPAYRDYLQSNVHLSSNLYQVISETVDYDQTKDEVARLRRRLGKLAPSK